MRNTLESGVRTPDRLECSKLCVSSRRQEATLAVAAKCPNDGIKASEAPVASGEEEEAKPGASEECRESSAMPRAGVMPVEEAPVVADLWRRFGRLIGRLCSWPGSGEGSERRDVRDRAAPPRFRHIALRPSLDAS